MNYRPITDNWILARPKVKFYGAYPSGFLHRARALLSVRRFDAVLHVCSGRIRDYPYRGLGPNDKLLDLDPAVEPDFVQDARQPLPLRLCADAVCLDCRDGEYGTGIKGHLWDSVLIDRPYTPEDAAHYAPGTDALPPINALLKNAISVVDVGSKVGVLDYVWPQPPKNAKEVAVISVTMGRNNRGRLFTVFERLE